MKRFSKTIFVVLLAGMLFHPKALPAEMTHKEIISKADEARGSLGGVEWKIKMESVEEGRKQTKTLKVQSRDFKSLAEFVSPPKVKGRKLLMIDRNMWFLSPGLSKPVPISPRQRLMGGASNGDIASTNYAGDYDATFISEESVNGEQCYLFDLIATSRKTNYDRIRYWISKERLVGVKSDFFTVSGKVFKSATMEYENSVMIQGKSCLFISKMTITNAVVKGEITTMRYRTVKLKEIPDSTFNLNLLVR